MERNQNFIFRWSPAERQTIEAAAKLKGCTITDLIREGGLRYAELVLFYSAIGEDQEVRPLAYEIPQ